MGISNPLSEDEKKILLQLARETISHAVRREAPPPIDRNALTPSLCEMGASFVTLNHEGQLRGCIGALEPYQPLINDVQEHARAAALEDYRFPPVTIDEIPFLTIEISRLTVPQPLSYNGADDLIKKLRPQVDGVILKDGFRRATFLPQVWEKLPDAPSFLSQLCLKMGAPADLWRRKLLQVFTYQVEEFHE